MTADGLARALIPGWPLMIEGRTLPPETIRWVTISPNGTISTHTSGNVVARVPDFEGVLFQWQLARDICALICPPGHVGLRNLVPVGSSSRGVVVASAAW
jgi:hypothetical protein